MGKVRRTYNVSARLVGLMAKGKRRVVRKGWSFKEDRRLSELAGSGKTLEQIVKAMNRTSRRRHHPPASRPKARPEKLPFAASPSSARDCAGRCRA